MTEGDNEDCGLFEDVLNVGPIQVTKLNSGITQTTQAEFGFDNDDAIERINEVIDLTPVSAVRITISNPLAAQVCPEPGKRAQGFRDLMLIPQALRRSAPQFRLGERSGRFQARCY